MVSFIILVVIAVVAAIITSLYSDIFSGIGLGIILFCINCFIWIILGSIVPGVSISEETYEIYNLDNNIVYVSEQGIRPIENIMTYTDGMRISSDNKYHIKKINYDNMIIYHPPNYVLEVPEDKIKKIDL